MQTISRDSVTTSRAVYHNSSKFFSWKLKTPAYSQDTFESTFITHLPGNYLVYENREVVLNIKQLPKLTPMVSWKN